MSKAPLELELESSSLHPAGHSCLYPGVTPTRGEGSGSTGWAPALSLWVELFNWSIRDGLLPEDDHNSTRWLLQVEVCLVILLLCERGLVQTTSLDRILYFYTFCLYCSLVWNTLSSFLQPGHPCSSFRSDQSPSGLPSTQLSLCHSTHCMVIRLVSVHPPLEVCLTGLLPAMSSP